MGKISILRSLLIWFSILAFSIYSHVTFDVLLYERVISYFCWFILFLANITLTFHWKGFTVALITFMMTSILQTKLLVYVMDYPAYHWFIGIRTFEFCMHIIFIDYYYSSKFNGTAHRLLSPVVVSMLTLLISASRIRLGVAYTEFASQFLSVYNFMIMMMLMWFTIPTLRVHLNENSIRKIFQYIGLLQIPISVSMVSNWFYWFSFKFDMPYDVVSYENFSIVFLVGLILIAISFLLTTFRKFGYYKYFFIFMPMIFIFQYLPKQELALNIINETTI